MNIVTPIPTAFALPTANFNTEAARRDNLLRDTIPAATESEKGAQQQGLGAEADRARTPGQKPAPVTYEKPQAGNTNTGQTDTGQTQANHQDNGTDQSAGRENASDQQQKQQAEERQIAQLKQRDQEVRTHEQAHAAVGGQYASAPQYEYETGPDNKRYVSDGEVGIDVAKAATAQQTIEKMTQVRRAALAPAEPSAQDLKVANEAANQLQQARSDVAKEQAQTPAAALFSEIDSLLSGEPSRRTTEHALDPVQLDRSGYDEAGMQQKMLQIQLTYRNTFTSRDAGFSASA